MTKSEFEALNIGDLVFVLISGVEPQHFIARSKELIEPWEYRKAKYYRIQADNKYSLYDYSTFHTKKECLLANIASIEKILEQQSTYLSELKKAAAPLLGNDC